MAVSGMHEVRRDPGVFPAADAVLCDVRLTRAIRDGAPAAHTCRMTISFTPDSRSAPS
jgi:hypothetical protein